jgi:hypothetical protein
MKDTVPIACTLTDADLRDRQHAWLKVGTYADRAAEIPGGLAFEFSPTAGVYASLSELVRLEAECCPWMAFRLEQRPEIIRMTVTADGDDGERAVRLDFAPLSDLVAQRPAIKISAVTATPAP